VTRPRPIILPALLDVAVAVLAGLLVYFVFRAFC